MKKALCVFMVLLFAVSVVGCNGEEAVETQTDTEAVSQKQEEDIVVEGSLDLSEYTIIRASGASTQLTQAVNHLKTYINACCGIEISVANDTSKVKDKEIQVGIVDRDASKSVCGDLKERDWAVKQDGDDIVITAGSDGATLYAIQWFKENCLTDGKSYAVVGEGTTYSYAYPVSKLNVGQSSIEDVTVAYMNADQVGHTDAAYSLAYRILDYYGVMPKIASFDASIPT